MPNVPEYKISCILLAAGCGHRFDSSINKLLHPLAESTPVILTSVRNIPCALKDVYVVVPPDHEALAMTLKHEGVHLVVNNAADQGMGSSIACGITAAVTADAWVILLADMPWIQPKTIKAVVDALEKGAALVAPCYQGQRGHPVGFHHRYGSELVKLRGDKGARRLLEQHATELHLIHVDDPGILLDVDTPADLTRTSVITK